MTDFTVKYIPAKYNGVADYLSRMMCEYNDAPDYPRRSTNFHKRHIILPTTFELNSKCHILGRTS